MLPKYWKIVRFASERGSMTPTRQPFFYERVTEGLSVPATGKVAISLFLGLLFFLLHYGSVGATIFRDFSWFLSILIATAMLTLYYATHTLMTLMPEIHRLGANPEKFTH